MLNKIIKCWKKYYNLKSLILLLFLYFLIVPFTLIFVFNLNKTWYDAFSVAALIYFMSGIFIITLEAAQFHFIRKIKNLFKIEKENNEKLTNFEKQQMKIFNIKNKDEDKEKKNNSIFISVGIIIYGLILICISFPFVFI